MSQQNGYLKLTAVRRAYGEFLLDIDLEVERGSLVSLLGASGSGKTTTLRMIAGFERIDGGRITYGGNDITDLPPWRRGFGFVPQNLVLFPHLDVAGNIGYGLKYRKIPKREIRERVGALLDTTGLSGFADRRVDTLSGGEQQRVAIARALAIRPGLLLLDEPFSALDAPLRREMREEVVRLKQELDLTVVFVTHNQDEALSISDRVVLLRDGSIRQQGRPEELFLRPADRFVAGFIGAANILQVAVADVRGKRIFLEGDCSLEVTKSSVLDPRPGQALHLLIRPHRLVLDFRDTVNAMDVRVDRRKYLGDRYEYSCTSRGISLTAISSVLFEVGWEGKAGFDPNDGYLLA